MHHRLRVILNVELLHTPLLIPLAYGISNQARHRRRNSRSPSMIVTSKFAHRDAERQLRYNIAHGSLVVHMHSRMSVTILMAGAVFAWTKMIVYIF